MSRAETQQWLIFAIPVALTYLLGWWGAEVQYVINPDGVLYLRAAELFAAGAWDKGHAVYPWPLYSLAIAGISSVSGLSSFASAQIFNVTCSALSAVIFLLLVRELTGNDRKMLIFAAFLITGVLSHALYPE